MYSCLLEYRKLHSPWTSTASFSLSSEGSSVLIASPSKAYFLLHYAISETPHPTQRCAGRRQNGSRSRQTTLAYGQTCRSRSEAQRNSFAWLSPSALDGCTGESPTGHPGKWLLQAGNSIKKKASGGNRNGFLFGTRLYWGTRNGSRLIRMSSFRGERGRRQVMNQQTKYTKNSCSSSFVSFDVLQENFLVGCALFVQRNPLGKDLTCS